MRLVTKLASMTSIFALAAVALAAPAVLGSQSAEARGTKSYGWSKHAYRYKAKPRRHARRNHRYDTARDPAIFSHEVDLSRPGGPKRFFELLNEESR